MSNVWLIHLDYIHKIDNIKKSKYKNIECLIICKDKAGKKKLAHYFYVFGHVSKYFEWV